MLLVNCQHTVSDTDKIESIPKTDTVDSIITSINYEYFEPIRNYADSTISNNSSFNVDLMYEQQGIQNDTFFFYVYSLNNDNSRRVHASLDMDSVKYFLKGDQNHIFFTDSIVFLSNMKFPEDNNSFIEGINVGTNPSTLDAKISEKNPEAYNYQRRYLFETCDIIIKSGISKCYDTGNNNVIFENNSGRLSFNNIGNVIIFERMLDGQYDLYLIDYRCCQMIVRVFKIS